VLAQKKGELPAPRTTLNMHNKT